MLSKQHQDSEIIEGIPVSREAYEQEKENCLKSVKGYDAWKSGGCKTPDTLKKIYSQVDSLIDLIDRCETCDFYVKAVIQDKLASFTDNTLSEEQTVKGLQQDIENYMKNGIMNYSWEERQAEINKPKTGKEVKLYYVKFMEYIPGSIEEYNKKYKSEDIIGELYSSYQEMITKTETELMAGGGPGLVLLDMNAFNSIRKVVSTGALSELDSFEKTDSSYKAADYYQNILNAGVFDGKRYFYPLFYNYRPFETSLEALKRNDINIDYSNWTWTQLHNIAMKFSKENRKSYLFDGNFSFYKMVTNSGLHLVDYDKKTCSFNTPEFKELLKYYKDFCQLKLPDSQAEWPGRMLQHQTCVLPSACGFVNPADLSYEYGLVKNDAGENLVIVPFPSYSGEKHYYMQIEDCVGINSKCKNKEAAYNFIKILLSPKIQSGVQSDGYGVIGTAVPVNKEGYKLSFDNWLKPYVNKIPKDILNFMDKNSEKLETPDIGENAILNILRDSAKSYIDGKKTLDQAVKEMDDKVSIFLNE
jgi:ABC-type glycerol-3-phosphate transport system substrate-binding protein